MSKAILVFTLTILVSGIAVAEKPEWAGKGKPTAEQKAAHKAAMNAKGDVDDMEKDSMDGDKEKKAKKAEKTVKGLEKQAEKKSGQAQEELDKGSETGQEASSDKKKWWKFWE